MKFGFFDDANKEYVIQNPRTPYPWINYLGTQEFFSLISNTAGGYHFFKDARLRRITRYRYNNVPVVTSISTTTAPSGLRAGLRQKQSWIPMNAVTVWAIPSSPERKMTFPLPLRSSFRRTTTAKFRA